MNSAAIILHVVKEEPPAPVKIRGNGSRRVLPGQFEFVVIADDDRSASRSVKIIQSQRFARRSSMRERPVRPNDNCEVIIGIHARFVMVFTQRKSSLGNVNQVNFRIVRQIERPGARTDLINIGAVAVADNLTGIGKRFIVEIDDKILGLDLGADDYLAKPFNMGELLARVRAIVRRGVGKSENLLRCGNVSLDPTTYRLSCGDQELKLSGKEYQMMELLIRQPGRVISTQNFMERIWGYDAEAEINVVWVYISALRKKLAQIGASVQIKATRGVGYSLEEEK